MTRRDIIDHLHRKMENDPLVYAMWLEGSDGLGCADEYSDIDFWLDVEDGHEEEYIGKCKAAFEELGELDFFADKHNPNPRIWHYVMHIMGTSEYWLLDVCVQSHSRGSKGATYVENDIAELPETLFDKCGIVTILPEPKPDMEELNTLYADAVLAFEQVSRVEKYIHRGEYMELVSHYMEYVCEPLITLARAVHTPRHCEYGTTHISRHLPSELVKKIERLYKFSSMEDISCNISYAKTLFEEIKLEFSRKYS